MEFQKHGLHVFELQRWKITWPLQDLAISGRKYLVHINVQRSQGSLVNCAYGQLFTVRNSRYAMLLACHRRAP